MQGGDREMYKSHYLREGRVDDRCWRYRKVIPPQTPSYSPIFLLEYKYSRKQYPGGKL